MWTQQKSWRLWASMRRHPSRHQRELLQQPLPPVMKMCARCLKRNKVGGIGSSKVNYDNDNRLFMVPHLVVLQTHAFITFTHMHTCTPQHTVTYTHMHSQHAHTYTPHSMHTHTHTHIHHIPHTNIHHTLTHTHETHAYTTSTHITCAHKHTHTFLPSQLTHFFFKSSSVIKWLVTVASWTVTCYMMNCSGDHCVWPCARN